MKFPRSLYLIAAASLALSGCASDPRFARDPNLQPNLVKRPQYRSGDYKGYSWFLEPKGNPVPGGSETLRQAFNEMQTAIDNDLATRGYVKTATGQADFRVGILFVLKDQEMVSTYDQYFGVESYPNRSTSSSDVTEALGTTIYEIGSLVIDIVDAKNHRYVWRGMVVTEVDRNASPEEQRVKIDKAVRNILADFPKASS